MSGAVAQVRKRDGRIANFDRDRITNAIFKAAQAVDQKDGRRVAETITHNVVATLERDFFGQGRVPLVEEIQDLAEAALIENGYVHVAKAYILYREQRAQVRDTEKLFLDGLKLIGLRVVDRTGSGQYIEAFITDCAFLDKPKPGCVFRYRSGTDSGNRLAVKGRGRRTAGRWCQDRHGSLSGYSRQLLNYNL